MDKIWWAICCLLGELAMCDEQGQIPKKRDLTKKKTEIEYSTLKIQKFLLFDLSNLKDWP